MVPEKNLKKLSAFSAQPSAKTGSDTSQRVGILTGPTATGKTTLALEVAKHYPEIEIVNADSLLVYREMNVGTAKPSPKELRQVPHHLIDIVDPNQGFTSGEFKRAAERAITDIEKRGKRALIVGGSGFYLKALLFGIWDAPPANPELRKKLESHSDQDLYQRLLLIDPPAALRIGASDRYRLIRALEIFELSGKTPSQLEENQSKEANSRFQLWIIDRPGSDLENRIQKRTETMMLSGILEEYQNLRAKFGECRPLNAIGYKQIGMYLERRKPAGRNPSPGLKGLHEEIHLATRQLVKQQRTWFRNQSANVKNAKWFLLDQDRVRFDEDFKAIYEDRRAK